MFFIPNDVTLPSLENKINWQRRICATIVNHIAEVSIFLNNSEKTGPIQFNELENIIVKRRTC